MSYTAPDKNKLVDPAFFSEEFDIDIDLEEYERIEVPDFSHGRRGRFIHDFSMVRFLAPGINCAFSCDASFDHHFLPQNKTGIIDLEAGRCFLLPLNRSRVLPPQSLYDLIGKMRSGYYDVDTEVVRESYRVVTPSIADVKGMGYYIGRECANLPSYYLEKVESPGTRFVFSNANCTNEMLYSSLQAKCGTLRGQDNLRRVRGKQDYRITHCQLAQRSWKQVIY